MQTIANARTQPRLKWPEGGSFVTLRDVGMVEGIADTTQLPGGAPGSISGGTVRQSGVNIVDAGGCKFVELPSRILLQISFLCDSKYSPQRFPH